MRSSLKKLRGLGLPRSEMRERPEHRPRAKLDELVQAVQDLQDMKSCYDGLLSSAAATANSAYEFSEALREMGTCLLEKTALHDDEDSGRVLLMLGKAQFEVQKLVDNYRTHIIQTITTPSECLLGELQVVEEMKQQCDDKRELYKLMLTAPRTKGKSRNSKGETVTLQQLKTAREDYEENANLFIFRLKSLKQGQSRSLLTQAARHHAAQLNFFRKGLKSLELIVPHVKAITEQQHIDYQFRGLDDDYTDFDDDGGSFPSDSSDNGELSFDYGLNEHVFNTHTTNSMEVDVGPTNALSLELLQEKVSKNPAELLFRNHKPNLDSKSAPIFAHKLDSSSDRTKAAPPSSSRRYHTYALPTPVEVRNSANISFSSTLPKTNSAFSLNEQKTASPVPKEIGTVIDPTKLPSPSDGSPVRLSPFASSDPSPMKWQAFSGPLMAKSGSTSIFSTPYGIQKVDVVQTPFSPSFSTNTSPPVKISTLHELPRPPIPSTKQGLPNSLIGHSAPLISRIQEIRPPPGKALPIASQTASPLPAPPPFVPRSFSIPYRGQKTSVGTVNKHLEFPRILNLTDDVDSPPLTPLSLKNFAGASPSPPKGRT